jgi:hypothetical protein
MSATEPGRKTRRAARRRRRGQRAALSLVAVAIAGAGAYGGLRFARSGHSGGQPAAVRRAVTTTTTTTTIPYVTTTTVDPGTLSQTGDLPPATSPQLDEEMDALWAGVVADSVQVAMPAFFPEAAYDQLKALSDPSADYAGRLVADYQLDITAAHALLGADPGSAGLVSVSVPEQDAHWVPPGVCANRIGYYEVANARVVYEQNGQENSFGIASLISWRGVWYVVHLGAVVRSGSGGEVDDPQSGPGASAPSDTC